PVRVEVNQDRDLRSLDRSRERLLVEGEGTIEQHRLPALATLGPVRRSRGVDAIPRLAELTAQCQMLRGWRCPRPGSRLRHALLQFQSLYWSDVIEGNRGVSS